MNLGKIKEKVITALKIREEIQNIFKKHNVNTSYCKNGVNPYYNQTDENSEGFICEYYYDSPSKIYTPLGYISIWDSSMADNENMKNANKEITDTFGFVFKEKSFNAVIGTFNSLYHVTKLPWNNTILSCDCIERTNEEYIEYTEVKRLYKEIL